MRQPNEECIERRIPISNDAQGKKKLTSLVKACYQSLDTYGGNDEKLESTVMLMQMVLGGYDYETIRAAFGVYLNNNSVMPKPADIVKIINPPAEKKKWCKVTFLEIKRMKREGQFTTAAEGQYIQDFMQASVSGDAEERELLGGAVKQAELEHKQYWIEG